MIAMTSQRSAADIHGRDGPSGSVASAEARGGAGLDRRFDPEGSPT